VFESRLGLRLFWCGRFVRGPRLQSAPAALSKGRVCFDFTQRGTLWTIVNGRRFVCRPGDLIVQRGGDISSLGAERGSPTTVLSFGVALAEGEVDNVLLHRNFHVHYTLQNREEYAERFMEMLKAFSAPMPVREWELTAALIRLLSLILRETKAPLRSVAEKADGTTERVQLAQAWAISNLRSPFDLSEWARVVNLPRRSFDYLFKQATGFTPKRWLEAQRMQVARQHLLSTGQSVMQIARLVGFEDEFYFSRVFRKHFGQSPLQYRRSALRF
jgi:AraC-like DNA-binding protein